MYIVIFFLLLIPFILIVIYLLSQKGILFGWRMMNPPSGNINRIYIENSGEILIEDKNKNIYSLKSRNGLHWENVEEKTGIGPVEGSSCHNKSTSFDTIPPILNVKSKLNGSCGMAEFGYSYTVVTDTNNNIWVWERGYSLYISEIINLLCYAILGIISISLLFIVIKIFK